MAWCNRSMNTRRTLIVSAATLGLTGCGFKLRGAQTLAFKTFFGNFSDGSLLGPELRRSLESNDVRVVTDSRALSTAQVVMDVLADQREKTVVGVNASGQVRELQLRVRFKFKLRNPAGNELIPETELLLQRDISFSETSALSKEAEELQIYRTLQSDIVQQVMRRLAALKSI
jgi:LPS-assembly lipoprotein